MKTVTHIAALTTVLLIGSATLAGPASQAGAKEMSGIAWTASPADKAGEAPTIVFDYDDGSTSFSLDDETGLTEVRSALAVAGGTAFTIVREPGTIACRGTAEASYDGRGTCAFTPDESFKADLRVRNLSPRDRGELLAMTLLGADRALIDGLIRAGVAPESAEDVIAAAALEVTPEYVAGLKSAGLDLRTIEDAVACRAVEVDAAYVRALADAGYRPDAERVVAMKAVGVTPEYARRMNAAAQN